MNKREWTLEQELALRDPQTRKRAGVYYTPLPAVEFLNRAVRRFVKELWSNDRLTIVDPACGDGRFLLNLANKLPCPTQLVGLDIMPEAVGITDDRLQQLATPNDWRVTCLNPLAELAISQSLLGQTDSLVVVGNPPYSNFGTDRSIDDDLRLWMNRYTDGMNERKVNLSDLYIQFIAWAHHQIESVGRGMLAFVTNHTYLTGPTYRLLRRNLLESFQQLFIIDLQGNKARRGNSAVDDNLFNIRTGICLTIAVKDDSLERQVLHADMTGTRQSKLERLDRGDLDSIGVRPIQPDSPLYAFAANSCPAAPKYESGWSLDRVFRRYVSGVQTKRDDTFVARSKDQLIERVKCLWESDPLQLPAWLRTRVQRATFDERLIQPYLVAPFDLRWVYYDPTLIGRARFEVLQHLIDDRENLAFIFMRQSTNAGEYDHFLVTRYLASDRCFYSAQGAPFLAPLCVDGKSNLAAEFCDAVAERLSTSNINPMSVFEYVVGLTGSEDYRRQYESQLGLDFPRVPLPIDQPDFDRHVACGKQLIELQTNIEPPLLDESSTGQPRSNKYPKWEAGRVVINDQQCLSNVSSDVWQLTIGGYRVLQRWLKQRSDHLLSESELAYARDLASLLEQVISVTRSVSEGDVAITPLIG